MTLKSAHCELGAFDKRLSEEVKAVKPAKLKQPLKFSWENVVRSFGAGVFVIQAVEVSHYLHHCPSFGLRDKPQQKQTTGDGVSHKNQEAVLAKAILDRKGGYQRRIQLRNQ